MRYAIVVKDVSDEMSTHAHGYVTNEKLQRNTLFKFETAIIRNGEPCAFCHSANYIHIIPLSWCMELTREEYDLFKKLERTDPIYNSAFRTLKEAVQFLSKNQTERLNEYLMKYLK